MSIADDPLFRELPRASRDRIKAAEIEREFIIRQSDAQALEIEEQYQWGIDPLGIDQMIYGPSQADLTARQVRAQGPREANWNLYQAATEELWKGLKPDDEALLAKTPEAWRLVYGSSAKIPEQLMRDLRARLLLLRAAIEEADSRSAAQPSRNKAAAARSRSKLADKLRRRIREMKSQGYTQQEMCSALDKEKMPTPEHANWGGLTWSRAYKDPKYRDRVKKCLSYYGREAESVDVPS